MIQVIGTNFAKLPIFSNTPLSSIDFDKELYQDIKVFPNPCIDGKLTIQLPIINSDYINASLLSVNGSLIHSASYKMQGKELQLQYNQLTSKSIYFLHLDWNGNSFYKKIITN